MNWSKLEHTQQDPWRWRLAGLNDVPQIVDLARLHFQSEIDSVFTPDENLFAKHLSVAVVEQAFDRLKTQLIVAEQDQSIIAYAWLNRGHYMTYAAEEIAEAAFAHIQLDISVRRRTKILAQILQQWILWCRICNIPVLVSSSIRQDQQGFLRLHELAGFTVRGSMAFMRIQR